MLKVYQIMVIDTGSRRRAHETVITRADGIASKFNALVGRIEEVNKRPPSRNYLLEIEKEVTEQTPKQLADQLASYLCY